MTDRDRLTEHVLQGLTRPQKALSSAWFYDDEGSRLFQQIMALPEYYLTRLEHELLRSRADELSRWIDPRCSPIDLIELGSGDGAKTLSLCQALAQREVDCIYRPMDVSAHALADLSRRFDTFLPRMAIEPVLGDYFEHWPLVAEGRRQVAMLLGSNLGNLDEHGAVKLLQRVHSHLRPGDLVLLGLDLVKDPAVLRAAYDDSQGVTAAFNLNLLTRLNRELGMDFDLTKFRHYASYCPLEHVARSFLVSQVDQVVHSRTLDRGFVFHARETIYTEQSQKYSLASIEHLARRSGFDNTPEAGTPSPSGTGYRSPQRNKRRPEKGVLMSNKTHLRQTMLDLAEGRLRFAEQTYAQYLVGAAGRGDEPSESDAASRAVNNAALAQAFECPIHNHQEALEVLRQIDFGPRDSVETGAVVRIDGRWFVIAVASDAFQCDGNTYMGISTQAPIYAAIADARAGDVVSFRQRELHIEEVL